MLFDVLLNVRLDVLYMSCTVCAIDDSPVFQIVGVRLLVFVTVTVF